MQLPANVFADRLSARRTVTVGTLVMAAGGLAFAAVDGYLAVVAARALVGFGGNVLFIAILRLCATWSWPGEFGRMSGFTIAVVGFRGILATTPLALVVAVGLALLAVLVTRDSSTDARLKPVHGVATPQTSLRGVLRNARAVSAEPESWLGGAVLFVGTGVNVTVLGLWGIPYLVRVYGVSVTYASRMLPAK